MLHLRLVLHLALLLHLAVIQRDQGREEERPWERGCKFHSGVECSKAIKAIPRNKRKRGKFA